VQHWLVFIGMCWLVSDATASNISPEARSQLAPEGAKVRGEDAKALVFVSNMHRQFLGA